MSIFEMRRTRREVSRGVKRITVQRSSKAFTALRLRLTQGDKKGRNDKKRSRVSPFLFRSCFDVWLLLFSCSHKLQVSRSYFKLLAPFSECRVKFTFSSLYDEFDFIGKTSVFAVFIVCSSKIFCSSKLKNAPWNVIFTCPFWKMKNISMCMIESSWEIVLGIWGETE